MTTEQEMKLAIQSVIKEMMDRIMCKVLVEDPFIKEDHRAEKPLYAALVPDEIFKGSHFERRFVTPFGSAWEKLAIVAAKKGLGHGDKGVSIKGQINSERLRRIQEVLNNLEHFVLKLVNARQRTRQLFVFLRGLLRNKEFYYVLSEWLCLMLVQF